MYTDNALSLERAIWELEGILNIIQCNCHIFRGVGNWGLVKRVSCSNLERILTPVPVSAGFRSGVIITAF